MAVAVQNEPVAAGKLIVAPSDAIQWVAAQIERGQAIRKVKLRYAEDLEKARERKAEWTRQTNELLKGMFDTESVAQEFNTWDVRVLPEYAEVSLFIEVFYEEMDQRLSRLQSIHRRIPAVTGPNGGSNGAPNGSKPAMKAAAKPSAIPLAVNEAPGTMPSQHQDSCLLVLHGEAGDAAERVAQFVSRLDFDPVRVSSDASDPKAAIESFEEHSRAAFAVILLDAETAAAARPGAGASLDSRLVFQLGYCVGKFGLRRVCVLMPDGSGSFCDDHGVLFVPLDPADGWQLQVARQLKRSGIEIDLNRMC